jgi:predicted dehydrogenase
MSVPVGLAVLGCGRISASHIAAIVAQPDCARLVATIDHDHALARDTARRHGAPHAFANLDEALRVDAVEAVLICTPNELHTTQTLQALAGGRHVLVEKPMAEDAAAALRMSKCAVARQRVLAIGHTFRHGPAVRYLQDHRAEFGELRSLEASQCVFWDGPQAPWWAERTLEQGLILSLFAPHALDFVQLAMQDDPLRVHVEAARHQPGWQGEDEAMILMAFPGRRMATVHVSYNQRRIVDRKLLLFDRGVLRIEDSEWLYWNDELRVGSAEGPGEDRRRMGGRDLSVFFRTQLREFTRAVRGLPHRSVLHDDGRRLIETIDRVRAAALDTSRAAIVMPQ